MFHRLRADPAVAVPTGVTDGQDVSGVHFLDRRRLGVQAHGPGRGRAALGCAQEQAQDELREAQPRSPLLLRQEHHPQDGGQALCLPLCVRSTGHAGVCIYCSCAATP